MKFRFNEQAVSGLELPHGRPLRFPHPFPADCIVAGLWQLAKDGPDSSDEVRSGLISVCNLMLSADNAQDQVDDLVHLLGLPARLREQLTGNSKPSGDLVALVFYGLERTLRLPHWWAFALKQEALESLVSEALAGLAKIYDDTRPNQDKILDGCLFVATQGGAHYRDRAAYEQRLRDNGINV